MAHTLRFTPLLTLLTLAACHASAASSEPPSGASAGDHAQLDAGDHALPEALDTDAAELGARYRLAITAFDSGAYDDAAVQFVQLLVRVPEQPSGDRLRHLLIQHIGWSLLGSFDMSGETSKLDEGETLLERYLAKHEQLLPDATAERENIYALLGEYSLRRDDAPRPDANARLRALVSETHETIERPARSRRDSSEDRMVREIEVQTIRWGSLDDPWIQAYLRDPRYTGASVFEQPGEPFNPARVLVRGWVGEAEHVGGDPANRRAYNMLRVARPALEGCYEDALGRGADVSERVDLELRWDARSLAVVEIADQTIHDLQTSGCVVEALRGVGGVPGNAGEARAALHLSFFVQPARWPGRGDTDYDYFGPARAPDSGPINERAMYEDVSINRYERLR